MSMWELLINNEVIDRVDLNTDKYEEAHTYFRLRKNLDNEGFNRIFIVKEYIKPKKSIVFNKIIYKNYLDKDFIKFNNNHKGI